MDIQGQFMINPVQCYVIGWDEHVKICKSETYVEEKVTLVEKLYLDTSRRLIRLGSMRSR